MAKLTKYQQQAVDFTYGNCLVSAGAGSGKTAVLTQRIYKLVKENICSLDKMLVLTFTNKAAFEMKQRVRNAIAKDDDLKHLLPQVEQAAITTFDGFALSLVKSYHYELGIDEDVNIVDDALMSVQRRRLLDQILEAHYEKASKGEDPEFLALVKAYCIKDDRYIIKSILNAYSLAALKADKREFLEHYMDNHFTGGFFQNVMGGYVSYIRYLLGQMVEGFNQYSDATQASLDAAFVQDAFAGCSTYEDYARAFALADKFPRIRNKKAEEKTPEDEEDRKLREELKKRYWSKAKSCCKYKTKQACIDTYLAVKPFVKAICGLAVELIDAESEFMRAHSCYRFEDVAYLARTLARKPEIREKLCKTYSFIMVDEYQDTSDLQEDLINLISTGNTFCVGDIKQSIYRFRNANPALFTSKLNTYDGKENGTVITLPDNFRSREQVIDDINAIFGDIMSIPVGGANYKAGHALAFGNHVSYDSTKGQEEYGVSVYRYQRDEKYDASEQEARLIAADILKKIKAGYRLKGGSKADFGDFAILTSSKTFYDVYLRVFNEAGIPLAVSSDIELKEEDIYFILRNIFDFLLCLTHHEDNVHTKHLFASISRSFVIGMPDEEIFHRIKENTYLETPWVRSLTERVGELSSLPLPSLFDEVLRIFDIVAKLPSAKNVLSNFERIETLYEASKTGSSFGWDLFDFVEYFKDLTNFDISLGQEIPPSDSKAVKLMSIHASKGLQFSIVYLPQLYAKFKVSIPGESALFSYDLDYGLLLPNVDEQGEGETVVSILHAAHDQQANVSERMRLFYVALTRAEENAILIQSKGKLDEDGNPIVPVRDTIASSKDFSDFMLFVKSPLKEKEIAVEPFVQIVSAKPQQERTLSFQLIQNHAKAVPLPKRPSKEIKGKIDEGALVFGTHLHRLLELADLKTRDVSWIKDAKERALLERVLSLPLLSDSANARIYKEYQFEDEQGQTGIIDLLLVYPDRAVIVDYKTSSIDDFSYDKQVKAYASYVTKTFMKPVKTYLLSILKAEVREIP